MCNYLSPPHLLAYMDGVAPTWVAQHVLHCPACRSRLAHWEKAHTRLVRTFQTRPEGSGDVRRARTVHLSAMVLGEYYLNTLPYETANEVWGHLQICPACQQRLNEAATFIDDRRPPSLIAYPWTPAGQVGAGWQPSLTQPVFSLERMAHAPAASHITFRVQEAEINLSIHLMGGDPAGYTIIGLVTGLTTTEETTVILTLPTQEHPVATTPLDIVGGFQLDHIPPGEYAMTIHTPQLDYILRAIRIQTTPSAIE